MRRSSGAPVSRSGCAPLAGKSTLNRLEPSRPEATRYHRISHDPAAIEARFVDLFLEAHRQPPAQITLDLDATDDLLHGHREGRFFHGYYDCFCYLPLYVFCGRHLLAAVEPRCRCRCGRGDCRGSFASSAGAGRGCGSCCVPIPASAATL